MICILPRGAPGNRSLLLAKLIKNTLVTGDRSPFDGPMSHSMMYEISWVSSAKPTGAANFENDEAQANE